MKKTIKKLKTAFECSNIEQLAEYLAVNRDTLFKAQRGEAGRHTMRNLQILEILIEGMLKKQFKRSLDKIRYLP
jgi:hypothetical protein